MTLTPEAVQVWRAEMSVRMTEAAPGLESLKVAPLPAGMGVVIAGVRDEMVHLPHFLRHHRASGARRFAFIDNGSVDGTLAYLLEQPDCDVYRHVGDYLLSASSAVWRNLLLDRYVQASSRSASMRTRPPSTRADQRSARCLRRRHAPPAARPSTQSCWICTVRDQSSLPVPAWTVTCWRYVRFDGEGYTIEAPADWRADNFPRLKIRGGRRCAPYGRAPEFAGWPRPRWCSSPASSTGIRTR